MAEVIHLKRTKRLYEMTITWYDGGHANAKTWRFWTDPFEYREEALRQFMAAFSISDEDEDSVRKQWFFDNGQIVLPSDGSRFYEIDYLDEVPPVGISMDGSVIVSVMQNDENIPYDIEQIGGRK